MSNLSEASEVSDVSGANSGASVASILRSVIIRVRRRSDAFPISTSMPSFPKTDLARRNRFPNEDTSRGHVFHLEGAASARSWLLSSPSNPAAVPLQ